MQLLCSCINLVIVSYITIKQPTRPASKRGRASLTKSHLLVTWEIGLVKRPCADRFCDMPNSEKGDATLHIRGIRLEKFTIFYNIFEGVVAIAAGLIASYISLIGFGIDSGIEVFAAALVLTRLRAQFYGGEFDETKERRALKLIGLTFFMLAIFVSFLSIRNLVLGSIPRVSEVGIALTLLSLLIMPFLANLKMKTGKQLGSILLIADAKETRLCAWLSVSTLAGLVSFNLFGWVWLDSVTSLVIAGFAIMEGREAWSGELVCDDCKCIGKCTC